MSQTHIIIARTKEAGRVGPDSKRFYGWVGPSRKPMLLRSKHLGRERFTRTDCSFHERKHTDVPGGSSYKRSSYPICCLVPVVKAENSTISPTQKAFHKLEYFLKAPIKPPVLASWPDPVPSSSSSLRIFLAKTLPNSTPHWSKLLMSQTAPSVNVRCS